MNQTDHLSEELSQVTAQFIKESASQYNAVNSQILDFGCGTGSLTNYVQELFWDAKTVGVDQSKERIAAAQATFPSIQFQLISERLPFADQSFDLIYSAYVFHHIAKEKRSYLISELVRVTKKGGAVLILEFNPWHIPTVFHFIFNKEEKGASMIAPYSLVRLMKSVASPKVKYYPGLRFSSSMYCVQITVGNAGAL